MPAARPGGGIRILERSIAAPLRKAINSAEPWIAAAIGSHLDLRHHAGRRCHPVVGGIAIEGLLKRDVNAIQARVEFVGYGGRKDVNVAERYQVTLSRTAIAEAWQVVALQ